MHVLISCFGSAGDVHPFMAIGQALRDRGHEVELLTMPFFRERIEAAGLGFAPVGTLEDYHQAVAQADIMHPRRGLLLLWQHVQRNLLDAYRLIAERARRDTVLVGSTLAWNSRLAQEKLGLPGATVHLSPTCVFSAHDPALWPGLPRLRRFPPWLVRPFLDGIERVVLDPVIAHRFDALRAQIGLPPARRVMSHWLNSPQRVILAFPDWFAAPQPDWPAHSVAVGFAHWRVPAGQTLDPALEEFLQAGPAPVGITPGSAMAHAHEMIDGALAACSALGLRALVVTPYREQLPKNLPSSVQHAAYVPFDLLLPRLRAFVHHGGIGTLAQCLAAGVPQLIAPFAFDQFDNAARLRQLGIGEQVAPGAGPAAWTRALRRLTQTPGVPQACAVWAQRDRAAIPAPLRVADLLEALPSAASPR